ncbi:hypothetical protein VSDG_06755 [Cytospora chrysosperma]|uniref:NACHT domain-containing protein n=1 Tax=Cytospora chrysosperma TaxID=252740 RepID=A0A423VRA8_CYTCH|nr:hypothetical protein VSDG_06755 [Valsa sordida]
MADPLSIAASIAGVISLADVVFTRTMKYLKAAKNADEDVRKLSREVLVLSGALSSLSKLAGELDTAGLRDKPIDDLRMHHIQACHATLDRIARDLKKLEGNTLKRKIIWPLTSERTQESFREVSRHKETINLALTANSMDTLLRLLSNQEKLHVKAQEMLEEMKITRKIVTRIRQDEQRRRVLDDFLIYNPQQNYETSLALRHPRTGLWLTLMPPFQAWLSSPDSCLWFSGIPGAGKTVLAGTVIEETLKKNSESVATMFFFCDYKDIKTQSPENILCVLASQLAIQHEEAYGLLERYHRKLQPKRGLRQSPRVVDLQKLLQDMMKSFDHVYLIVDGLDECGPSTSEVVKALLVIINASDNISVAFLSRDEDHIRYWLEKDFENVEIAAHTEDITEFVTSEVEKRVGEKRLHFNDLTLKGEILDRLVDGAKGMFRWVALQLDSLEYCVSDKDCRKALDRLPPGLDESYARILQQVPDGKERLVQKMLNFIAYADPKLRIPDLIQALSVPDEVTAGQAFESHSIIREDFIPKLCKSLIRKSNDGKYYEFAHFTVQEFLEGQMVSMPQGELGPFRLSKSICNRLLAIQCLKYLQFKDFDHWSTNLAIELDYLEKRNEEHPFYMYAAEYWPVYARNEWTDQSLDLYAFAYGGDNVPPRHLLCIA